MAVFKCKICGGGLNISPGMTVCECEYCGIKQTVPDVAGKDIRSSFNRAGMLRIRGEFDKAEALYAKLARSCPAESEARWGLLLCRYGVEYAQDSKTLEYSPLCHIPSTESVKESSLFKQVMENAAAAQRGIYIEEADRIEKSRKEIINKASKEKPADVYICCMGDDKTACGIAEKIYARLSEKNLRVFYGIRSLKGKTGADREAALYSAVNSAGIMLVLGSEPEYFYDAGVTNEWMRFLKLTKSDSTKILVPCFGDMDVYDMPQELTCLNFRSMNREDFVSSVVNDIVSGSMQNKKPSTEKPVQPDIPEKLSEAITNDAGGKEENGAGSSRGVASGFAESAEASETEKPSAEALLKRAFIFIEDRNWQSAEEYGNKVLDLEPENAQAYLIRLMAEKRVSVRSKLKYGGEPLEENINFKRIMRFGDEALKKEMQEYADNVRKNSGPVNPAYAQAMELINLHNTENEDMVVEREDVIRARQLLSTIPDYRDSAEYIKACDERIKEIDYQRAVAGFGVGNATEAWLEGNRKAFIALGDYRDSAEYAVMCEERIKTSRYDEAFKLYDYAEKNVRLNQHITPAILKQCIDDLENAKKLFSSVEDYKESKEYLKKLNVLLEDAREAYTRISHETIEKKGKAARRRRIILTAAAVVSAVAIIAAGTFATVFYFIPEGKYNDAVSKYDSRNYAQAAEIFSELGDYKDSYVKKANSLALLAFSELSDEQKLALLKASKNIASLQIFSTDPAMIGVKSDGTAIVIGMSTDMKNSIADWSGIVAVSARNKHIVGLKRDGSVVAAGNNDYGQCDVSSWINMAEVSAGAYHTVGLTSAGTVNAVGSKSYGQLEISGWSNITAVSAGDDYTAGLVKDGTVKVTRITGPDDVEQFDVSDWTDVVQISAGDNHLVGLKNDGTVYAVGDSGAGQCDVDDWRGIVAVSAGNTHTVGLRADGTVVAVGNNYSGKCNVEDWKDIVAVSAGYEYTLGLRKDGTVVLAGNAGSVKAEIEALALKTGINK